MTETFGVVIPCYNAARWIGQAIESVLVAKKGVWEVVVVDDRSDDGSLAEIRKFGGRILCIDGEGIGPSAARNRGYEAATASRILFLDADDYVEGGYLDGLRQACNESKADLIIGGLQIESESGVRQTIIRVEHIEDAISFLKQVLGGLFLQTACVLWDRQLLHSIGGWREDVRLGEDIELLIRALLVRPNLACALEGCVIHRNHFTPSRLTKSAGPSELEKQFQFSNDLMGAICSIGDIELTRQFGMQHYDLAVRAFQADLPELGFRSLERSRELGYREHQGPWAKRLLASVIGLERQIKLVKAARARKGDVINLK